MEFSLFITFLILQRLSELYVSSRNEKWLLARGAVEYGKNHYPYIVAMHTLFIVSLIAEYVIGNHSGINSYLLMAFLCLLIFKYWVISSLGKYWNTKIYRVPGAAPVQTGAYKLIRHPNYIIVICEIALIPMLFNLYYTALIFSILNAFILYIRIAEENKVWKQV